MRTRECRLCGCDVGEGDAVTGPLSNNCTLLEQESDGLFYPCLPRFPFREMVCALPAASLCVCHDLFTLVVLHYCSTCITLNCYIHKLPLYAPLILFHSLVKYILVITWDCIVFVNYLFRSFAIY